MFHFTLLCRQYDGLALVADTDSSLCHSEEPKVLTKNVCRRVAEEYAQHQPTPAQFTVIAAPYAFHVAVSGGVVAATVCDSVSSNNIAFAYLDEILREFHQQYQDKLAAASRPYCFIKFDLYLQKTKKAFAAGTASRAAAFESRGGALPPMKIPLKDFELHGTRISSSSIGGSSFFPSGGQGSRGGGGGKSAKDLLDMLKDPHLLANIMRYTEKNKAVVTVVCVTVVMALLTLWFLIGMLKNLALS